jgi:hypothetical protein
LIDGAGTELSGRVLGYHLTNSDVLFRVHYSPGQPYHITQWAARLSDPGPAPLLIFPGGFFTADYLAQGLLVADGILHGEAHEIGGVFVVRDGQPDIRSVRSQPVQPDEVFEQGVQSFPVYFIRGEQVFVNEHITRAPRTVLVQTTNGDFMVLLSLGALFRTTDLPGWLAQSGLGVYSALNLDGGRSTGYWAGDDDYYDSFVPLPAVIAAYRK